MSKYFATVGLLNATALLRLVASGLRRLKSGCLAINPASQSWPAIPFENGCLSLDFSARWNASLRTSRVVSPKSLLSMSNKCCFRAPSRSGGKTVAYRPSVVLPGSLTLPSR